MLAEQRSLALVTIAVAAIVVAVVLQPVPQDPAYHDFADGRTLLGIPNFWDVLSNLPFAFIGLAGLQALRGGQLAGYLPECRSAFAVFFAGVACVALGSAYYHWEPSNATLVWDRLPMAVSFMAFFVAILAENISITLVRRLLWPFVAIGIVSVMYWAWTEQAGAGDLRFYALVQFLPMVLLPLVLLMYRSPFRSNRWLWAGMAAYLAAKLLEAGDAAIFDVLPLSGHTLKHLAAAAGAWFILRALQSRQLRAPSGKAAGV